MNVKRRKIPLFIIATLLFAIKTYIIYRFMFNLELENTMQEFILLINPFVSAFLIFAMSVWFKSQSRQMNFLRHTALLGTLILYSNLVFYRANTDFITISQMLQVSNMGDLGSSILTLIKLYDVLLFVDVATIWYLSKKKQDKMAVNYHKSGKAFALAMSLLLLAGNFFIAEMERPQLFTRTFDREYLVKNIGVFNYHIYDAIMQSKVKTQRVFADESKLSDISEYINEIQSKDQSDFYGVAEGKNLIFISVESLQNFVINNEVNGEEITPFLNSLVENEDTFYFENFYSQVAQGRTSDSEFLVENSLYPLSSGAVFFTHGQNEYNALPEQLKEKGYYNTVFHANNRSFWNRDQMYKSLGYDYYYGEEAYEVTENNSIGWGLKDKAFFEQSMKYLQSFEQPFYSKFITLTNHFPFNLDEKDRTIEPYNSNSNTLNNYFPTVRYTDEALEQFFNQLKDTGIYEDSIIVIMGDHFGISENHNKSMSQYLGKEKITPYDQLQLLRVPLFIHIPGSGNGKVMSDVSGQIDVKPTLLHLLGIETENDINFGNDLFSDDRKGFVAFRNGDFVTESYVSASSTCYNRQTGEPVDENNNLDVENKVKNPCAPIKKKVMNELEYSDEIIYGDLFRFVDFSKSN
ncbi:LTA synthase family protein [Oceanobacillus bengalensis]|uniref:LTA synthase family protein n=1 Tax=Oceanobacillus bengalensis TaxID=1435466 RepID=A0A494Z6U1_9BACI|nr:LTA synthase family protein [Oceanobacillus bengalensis]RKQ18292.1 LTA synthase family protein [Oceanobacillus bengalensis]